MSIISQNPATEEVLATFEELSWSEIDQKLDLAKKAFNSWKQTSFKNRSDLMLKLAKLLRSKARDYGTLMTAEMGKPITQSIGEVEKCAWVCEYYAENAEKFLADDILAIEGAKSYIHLEPLGVVLAVMPWNFPFWQVFRFAAPAVMAGNVGVLKHASNVPQSALNIEKAFLEAGFPKGVFTTLLVTPSPISQIITDDRIAAVTLTGSEATGAKIAEVAGKNIKKTVLELGGSDPFIVLADADVKFACQTAVSARNINSGQSCIAAKRFIVERPVAKEFTDLYVEIMKNQIVGDPTDPKTQVGPLARKDLRDQLHEQVMQSVAQGAKILTGGKPIIGKGFYYEPTVLSEVTKGMPAYDDEIFGPVASIIVVENEEHAVRVANDHRYGLGASLWSADLVKAEKLAHKIEAGVVFINNFVKSDPRLAFGGVKKSGYGRELGSYGIKEFVNIKTVVIK